jgi:hypothetical protein
MKVTRDASDAKIPSFVGALENCSFKRTRKAWVAESIHQQIKG